MKPATVYARKRRAAKLAAANARARTCQRGNGPRRCGGPLVERIDRTLGRVTVVCLWCERREAGVCRDCPRPVAGTVPRAIRCVEDKAQAQFAAQRRHREANRDRINARARTAYDDPAVRERRNAYKRLWRKANPEKIAAQKYRAAIRHNAARDKMLKYHRVYNAERRAAKAEAMRQQYREGNPAPSPRCLDCQREIPGYERVPGVMENVGRPPKRCALCMDPAQLRASVRRWEQRTTRELSKPARRASRRVKMWKPRATPTRFNAAGDRLCWTEGCEAVVRSRQKKCSGCKARERELAALSLMEHAGRGRRTDLAHRRVA